MPLWCQGKCSLGSCLFHCVFSMPHPQWHERCLAVADGRGRKPKQLEHLTRAVFHCREKKNVPLLLSCNITMLCHNAFPGYRVSHCLLTARSCCSSVTFHREIQRACLLSVYVTVVNDFSCSWSHNYVIVVCDKQWTTDWADVSWIVIIVIIIWTQLHCQYPKCWATNELHTSRCTSKNTASRTFNIQWQHPYEYIPFTSSNIHKKSFLVKTCTLFFCNACIGLESSNRSHFLHYIKLVKLEENMAGSKRS